MVSPVRHGIRTGSVDAACLGPIFYLNIAGQDTVVIGSHKVAADLLDRRAMIYSDRARNIVASELLTGGLIFAFSQHNDVWKRMRRGAHEYAVSHVKCRTLAETILQGSKQPSGQGLPYFPGK